MTASSIPDSFLLRGTAAGNTLRLVGMDSGRVVEDARLRHHLSKTATAALGRTLTASALLAVVLGKKVDSRVTVRVEGGGPVGWIVAEGSASGQVRGYVREPGADLPLRESDGKLDVSGIVGNTGELAVTRLLDNGEPYTGSIELVSGEIAEDISSYLGVSEQIPNAVLLGVYEEGGRVAHAGGLLIQAMPGVSDETLAHRGQHPRAGPDHRRPAPGRHPGRDEPRDRGPGTDPGPRRASGPFRMPLLAPEGRGQPEILQ